MSFTLATAGRIPVVLTYEMLDPTTGDKIGDSKCRFVMRRYTSAEAKADERDAALNETQKHDSEVLDLLARYLLEPPQGFDDFPLTRAEWEAQHPGQEPGEGQAFAPDGAALSDRARAYFSRDEVYLFADHAIGQWRRKVVPQELLFRV